MKTAWPVVKSKRKPHVSSQNEYLFAKPPGSRNWAGNPRPQSVLAVKRVTEVIVSSSLQEIASCFLKMSVPGFVPPAVTEFPLLHNLSVFGGIKLTC